MVSNEAFERADFVAHLLEGPKRSSKSSVTHDGLVLTAKGGVKRRSELSNKCDIFQNNFLFRSGL